MRAFKSCTEVLPTRCRFELVDASWGMGSRTAAVGNAVEAASGLEVLLLRGRFDGHGVAACSTFTGVAPRELAVDFLAAAAVADALDAARLDASGVAPRELPAGVVETLDAGWLDASGVAARDLLVVLPAVAGVEGALDAGRLDASGVFPRALPTDLLAAAGVAGALDAGRLDASGVAAREPPCDLPAATGEDPAAMPPLDLFLALAEVAELGVADGRLPGVDPAALPRAFLAAGVPPAAVAAESRGVAPEELLRLFAGAEAGVGDGSGLGVDEARVFFFDDASPTSALGLVVCEGGGMLAGVCAFGETPLLLLLQPACEAGLGVMQGAGSLLPSLLRRACIELSGENVGLITRPKFGGPGSGDKRREHSGPLLECRRRPVEVARLSRSISSSRHTGEGDVRGASVGPLLLCRLRTKVTEGGD